MLVFSVLMSALVALCYSQLTNPPSTVSPTPSGIESEDEPRIPQVSYRVPSARRTNVLATQVRQNAPSPQVRGVPQQETYRPYAFNYVAEGDDGMSSREETADGSGRVVGSYTLALEDGRKRRVDYVADADGFRANVDTNEPGTDSQNPADVLFYSSVAGGAPPSRGVVNTIEAQRPPRTGSRTTVQGRPSAPYTHYVDSGHYHHQHPQAVYYDDRYGSDYVVYRRPQPYLHGDYQAHYY